MEKPKILIADDDRAVCQSLKLLFLTQGFEVQYLINPLNIIEFIDSFKPNILLLDMNFSIETSGEEGLEILKKVKENYKDLPVILITAWATLDLAVAGMKLGAIDFITKPWNNDSVVLAVKTQLQFSAQTQEVSQKKLDKIVGQSAAIKNVKSLIEKVAQTDAPVLILGESGTGKDFIAEIIHDLSDRTDKTFAKIDIRGADFFDRELLGFRKNAFPGANLDTKGLFFKVGGGTLYLDQVNFLTPKHQTQLMSILVDRKYNQIGSEYTEELRARLISSAFKTENIREDLIYKLGLVQIKLPSLSEIQEDIPLLAKHFLENASPKNKKIEPSAADWLSTQDFKDNIRELKNWIERAHLLSEQSILTIKELKKFRIEKQESKSLTLEEMEKNRIQEAILTKKGNMSAVAQSLGITRSTLYRRMAKFGINHSSENED